MSEGENDDQTMLASSSRTGLKAKSHVFSSLSSTTWVSSGSPWRTCHGLFGARHRVCQLPLAGAEVLDCGQQPRHAALGPPTSGSQGAREHSGLHSWESVGGKQRVWT